MVVYLERCLLVTAILLLPQCLCVPSSAAVLNDTHKLLPTDAAANSFFGTSVSFSHNGTYALVGSPARGTASQGAAYVFMRSSSGAWSQQAKLTAADAAANDAFGHTVSLSGDGSYAIIGSRSNDTGTNSGSAYVFTRSGSAWTQTVKLIAPDAEAGAFFGLSVAMSENGVYAVVGAPFHGAQNNGTAYVYVRSGSTWGMQAQLHAADGDVLDNFGWSVAISSQGSHVIIGAYEDDGPAGGFNDGSAYVFVRSGTVWSQQARLAASDGADYDQFGWSVALSANAEYAVVGASESWPGGIRDSGSAYVFMRTGTVWAQQAKLVAPDPAIDDEFGIAVALSPDGYYALIGAHRDDSRGSVYVFNRSATTWTFRDKLLASDARMNDDRFGLSVSVSGTGRALVGAKWTNGDASGAAYIFDVYCPTGSLCPGGAVSNATTCSAGYYCPPGATNPTACSAGYYCPAGSSAPLDTCNGGYYCPTTTQRLPCTSCATGFSQTTACTTTADTVCTAMAGSPASSSVPLWSVTVALLCHVCALIMRW